MPPRKRQKLAVPAPVIDNDGDIHMSNSVDVEVDSVGELDRPPVKSRTPLKPVRKTKASRKSDFI